MYVSLWDLLGAWALGTSVYTHEPVGAHRGLVHRILPSSLQADGSKGVDGWGSLPLDIYFFQSGWWLQGPDPRTPCLLDALGLCPAAVGPVLPLPALRSC